MKRKHSSCHPSFSFPVLLLLICSLGLAGCPATQVKKNRQNPVRDRTDSTDTIVVKPGKRSSFRRRVVARPQKKTKYPKGFRLKHISFVSPAPVLLDGTLKKSNYTPFLVAFQKAMVKTLLNSSSIPRKVILALIMTPSRHGVKLKLDMAASPPFSKARRNQLLAKMQKGLPSVPKVNFYEHYVLLPIYLKEASGSHNALIRTLFSRAMPARFVQKSRFRKASTRLQLKQLQQWAFHQVLPTLGTMMAYVNPKFKGVRSYGRSLLQFHSRKVLKADIPRMTYKNPMYWRATMEMAKRNQIVPVTRIFLHVINGEIDAANRLMRITRYFSGSRNAANTYLKQLRSRLALFYGQFNRKMAYGIRLHDRKLYKAAILHYSALLKQFPCSVRARYEKYYSQEMQRTGGVKTRMYPNWNTRKKHIFDCDPLFSYTVKAVGPKQTYLMFRRVLIRYLFRAQRRFTSDLVEFADSAMELGHPEIAAHVYWWCLGFLPRRFHRGRNMGAFFLYSLEKLGIREFHSVFNSKVQAQAKTLPRFFHLKMVRNKLYLKVKKNSLRARRKKRKTS